jgi:hypothetical protein
MATYKEQLKQIKKELRGHTLSDFEEAHGINKYDYTGVGFGYNLQDNYPKTKQDDEEYMKTPDYDALVKG